MITSLAIVLPVFALILCGYQIGRKGWVTDAALKGLSFFVYYLASPALLFRTMAKGNLSEDINLPFILAFYSAALVVFSFSAFLGRRFWGYQLKEMALMSMGSTYSNMLLLGFPLVYSAFGDEGMVPLTVLIAFQAPILMALTSMLTEYDLSRDAGAGRGLRVMGRALVRAVIRNPIILSLVAGALYQTAGFDFFLILDRFTSTLGGAVVPCALFSLGVSLNGFKLAGDLKQSFLIVALKTLVYPGVVALLIYSFVDVPPLWGAVAVILAAQPTGVNVFILAQQYGVFTARAASIVLASTTVSVVTVTLLIAHYVSILPGY
ncbi:AEC family transporter [Kiloniella laminariae]|uniref:AEC family transporter n=1 Tax=Kiloniella laminariae TaxID=454162 RepID=UPI000377919B|nr:AEC family transporter [Kiloniella laminariae]